MNETIESRLIQWKDECLEQLNGSLVDRWLVGQQLAGLKPLFDAASYGYKWTELCQRCVLVASFEVFADNKRVGLRTSWTRALQLFHETSFTTDKSIWLVDVITENQQKVAYASGSNPVWIQRRLLER